jgi:methylglutaconyl-CoA hydratase
MSDLVRYERHSAAAILTLNRPDRRNALSRELVAALTAAVAQARDDSAVRCVVLTGAGTAFCAGMDLAELQESLTTRPDPKMIEEDALSLGRLYDLICTLPKPTVAAVNGAAVAGGAGLVSVCDLAVAASTAKFGYPEVRRGLVAAMVLPHLLRHAGERLARYLLLTGELIDGTEAHRAGLINEVVAADQVLPRALEWCRSLAEGGPQALTLTKDLFRRLDPSPLSLEETARASAAPRSTEECRQGLEAFFAKHPAPWTLPSKP